MIRRPHNRFRRPGAAIAEFAIVMTAVVFPLMLGIWEMGRAIQVQQIVSNVSRLYTTVSTLPVYQPAGNHLA